MEYVPCIGNSSYSFWWILLKLYRCFKDGLEICILFFQNPEIIFYHFFRIFNLDIFRALILQICIWSIYLVSATPPTVFGESFWNFTVVFRMVWRYAYCFLRILKLFFLHFNLDIFSSLYATDMYREYMPCIGNPAYSFRPILLKLYRYFAAFLWFHMRNLSLAGYNCSGGASCMACSFIINILLIDLWIRSVGLILEGDLEEIVSQIWLTTPDSELIKKFKCIECKGKSNNSTKTSPRMLLNSSLSDSSWMGPDQEPGGFCFCWNGKTSQYWTLKTWKYNEKLFP